MACCLFGAKPLPEPMLPYWQLSPNEQTSVKFFIKIQNFSFTKMHLKTPAKWRPFCPWGDEFIQFLPLKKSVITQFIWPLPPPAATIGDGELGFPRADSRFAPSRCKTALLCNDISHWLDASLESVLFPDWPLSPQVISVNQGFLRASGCHSLLGH